MEGTVQCVTCHEPNTTCVGVRNTLWCWQVSGVQGPALSQEKTENTEVILTHLLTTSVVDWLLLHSVPAASLVPTNGSVWPKEVLRCPRQWMMVMGWNRGYMDDLLDCFLQLQTNWWDDTCSLHCARCFLQHWWAVLSPCCYKSITSCFARSRQSPCFCELVIDCLSLDISSNGLKSRWFHVSSILQLNNEICL